MGGGGSPVNSVDSVHGGRIGSDKVSVDVTLVGKYFGNITEVAMGRSVGGTIGFIEGE